MDFWNNFTLIEKVFIFIAMPSTVLLIIQLLLQLIGIDSDHDIGNDNIDENGPDYLNNGENKFEASDSHPFEQNDIFAALRSFHLFTFRGFVSFFAISGWTGLLFMKLLLHPIISIILAFICGLVSMVLLALLVKMLMRLQSDGTINLKNAIGIQGEVYLRIPANNQGKGKVSFLIQERFREFDAITYEKDTLLTGTMIRVVDVISNDVVVVEKID